MVRTIFILVAAILAIVYKQYDLEVAKYISLMVASGCIGSIIQELVDERKSK